jgi:RHS repeat-associated protein
VETYGYEYDGLDRLVNAYHGSGPMTLAQTGAYSVNGISYDKNGNILTLGRLSNGEIVDELYYRYAGNRLMNVRDASGHPFGYDNTGALMADRYAYDANGNMTKDLNRGISDVSYNFLNLPRQVTRGGQTVKYVYSVSGAKLKNILPGKTLEYVDGFVYEDGTLSYILTGEGRYVANGSTGTHEYNLADHLGNVRAVIDQEGNVLQKTDYYPFGMPIARAGGSDNKYLYNGKEEQEETGWLDYGARMYDASIGRWFNMDVLAEKYYTISPYVYCLNNPLVFIDPTGMWVSNGTGALIAQAGDNMWTLQSYLDEIYGVGAAWDEWFYFQNQMWDYLQTNSSIEGMILRSRQGTFENLVGKYLRTRAREDEYWESRTVKPNDCSPTTFRRVDKALEFVYGKDVLGMEGGEIYARWQNYANSKGVTYGPQIIDNMGYGTLMTKEDILNGKLTPGALIALDQYPGPGPFPVSWHSAIFLGYTRDEAGNINGMIYWQQRTRQGPAMRSILFDYDNGGRYDFSRGYKPLNGTNFK